MVENFNHSVVHLLDCNQVSDKYRTNIESHSLNIAKMIYYYFEST